MSDHIDLGHYVGRVNLRRKSEQLRMPRYGDLMGTAELTPISAEALWARVAILLNLGRIDEATQAGLVAAAATVWADDWLQLAGPFLHSLQDMPAGWAFLVPDQNLAVFNRAVVDEFCMSACLFVFARTTLSLDGPAFRWYDVENWRLLERMNDAEWEARNP